MKSFVEISHFAGEAIIHPNSEPYLPSLEIVYYISPSHANEWAPSFREAVEYATHVLLKQTVGMTQSKNTYRVHYLGFEVNITHKGAGFEFSVAFPTLDQLDYEAHHVIGQATTLTNAIIFGVAHIDSVTDHEGDPA